MWLRPFAAALLSLGLALSLGPRTGQSAHRSIERSINWQRYDTATYVVSTLNLLHTRTGYPVVPEWLKRGVRTFEVYADENQPDLYFIELRDDAGQPLGALAYEMGWQMPRGITSPLLRIHLPPAPRDLTEAYQKDPKDLMASFSTLPGIA